MASQRLSELILEWLAPIKYNGVYEDWILHELAQVAIVYDRPNREIGNSVIGFHKIRVMSLKEWELRFKTDATVESHITGSLPEDWLGIVGHELAEDLCKMLGVKVRLNGKPQQVRFEECMAALKRAATLKRDSASSISEVEKKN